jgi:ABC-type bacteriocin/lantibiotic exporter with double-glycine peptidase domain
MTAALLSMGCRPAAQLRPPVISNVPFFPDDTQLCGPSTLASVLTHAGIPTTPEELKKDVYFEKMDGTLPMDMAPAARARGADARTINGTWDDLRARIQAGQPVVALLNLGLTALPREHFVVVIGMDDKGVYMHSGMKEIEFYSTDKFDKAWKKMGRWMLIVDKKDRP